MAHVLIVEDGTIVANANSYVTIDEADAYHEIIGNDDWASYEAVDKKKALLIAARSLDLMYSSKFMSIPQVGSTQVMRWPRLAFWARHTNKLINGNQIPSEIKDAQSELALMQLNGLDLFPVVSRDEMVTQESTQIGDISISKSYAAPVSQESFPEFRRVDLILQPVIKAQSGSWNWKT